jgi:hypothetical protein
MPARKKSTATRKKAVARKPARKRSGKMTEYGGRRYRVTIESGELFGEGPDGQRFEPVACGLHRSAAIHETATDDEDETPDGFDPGCEDCVAQAESTANYAFSHHTV